MENFFSMPKMKKYIKKLKRSNSIATVLGLDIGRVYVGTALTDRTLLEVKAHKTLILKSGLDSPFYPKLPEEYNRNLEFFDELNQIILLNKVKGIIIGVPVQTNEQVNIIFLY